VVTDSIPQEVRDQPQQIESAEVVVGILAPLDPEAILAVCQPLQSLAGISRIAVVRTDDRNEKSPLPSQIRGTGQELFFVPSTAGGSNGSGTLSSTAYQTVFATGEKLQARLCCVLASRVEPSSPQRAYQLIHPLIERNLDLIVPHYARRKFEGLLNACVIAPLLRSLYGRRLHNPMGPDICMSRRLFEKMLDRERNSKSNGQGFHPLASAASTAIYNNMFVAEVSFPTRLYPPPDWTNTSTLLAEALGPVFLDMERHASYWQRVRVSEPVISIGQPIAVNDDAGSPDMTRLVESFQLGNRELQEIWGLVLPPYTLFELRKLSRLPIDQFQMSDDLWVRIVYDFALAHRLRTINRDHLLKSMTPLYLGWVASYAHESQTESTNSTEQRIERLAAAFEGGKPYLLSRWRWPDRFNP
jgi:glucosylglycerate synthase